MGIARGATTNPTASPSRAGEAVDPGRGWMSWSSGKDSAFALHTVRTGGRVEITGLLTTVTAATDRVAVHRVRRVLLQAQADTLGLPLHVVELPRPCPNDVYEQRMTEAMASARQAGAEQLGSSFAGEGGGVEA